jgi:DNA mismatch endonuclease, patch repair protein
MESVRTTGTRGELALRSALHRLGLRFRVDRAPIAGLRRRADIVFARARVAVYVDGCFWHSCPVHGTWPKANAEFWRSKIETNKRRDLDTNAQLEANGWLAVRIWEHEDPSDAAQRIAIVVGSRLRRA